MTTVVLAASFVDVLVSIVLAIVLALMLARPLGEVGAAARRIADGDYASRVPRDGPEEIPGLADSFNRMAVSLHEQERMRRDFIARVADAPDEHPGLPRDLARRRDRGRTRHVRVSPRGSWPTCSIVAVAMRWPRATPQRSRVDSSISISSPRSERPSSWPHRRSNERECGLVVEVPDALRARGDPDGIAQGLANLLSNAVPYTPSGGVVTECAERRLRDILVSVLNTGDGIPPEDLGRIFERFYRVEESRDRTHGGAGIALAIMSSSSGALAAPLAPSRATASPAYGSACGPADRHASHNEISPLEPRTPGRSREA